MKSLSVNLFLLVTCLVLSTGVLAQEDEEVRPPAALAKGLLRRGLLTKGKQGATSTSTTTQPPKEAPEYEDEAEYQGSEAEAADEVTPEVPTSTEGKKIKAGVRPFRSNDDLLASLKRRRQNAAAAKGHVNREVSQPAASSQAESGDESSAPIAKASSFNASSKKRFSAAKSDLPATDESSSKGRSRFGRARAAPIEAEPVESEPAAVVADTGNVRSFQRRGKQI